MKAARGGLESADGESPPIILLVELFSLLFWPLFLAPAGAAGGHAAEKNELPVLQSWLHAAQNSAGSMGDSWRAAEPGLSKSRKKFGVQRFRSFEFQDLECANSEMSSSLWMSTSR